MTIIDHYEKYLGEVGSGWNSGQDGRRLGFQILRFQDRPKIGTTTFVTAGLSKHLVSFFGQQLDSRVEFLIAAQSKCNEQRIAAVLAHVCERVVATHTAPRPSDTKKGEGAVIGNPIFDCLLFVKPINFDKFMQEFNGSVPSTQILQIIPISLAERLYVHQHGIDKFISAMELKGVDIFNIDGRSTIID